MEHMQTQLNIRNNVRDMQTYVKDLYAWEEQIKSKDDSLRKVKASSSNRAGVPAVRGQAAPVVGSPRPELMRPAASLSRGADSAANGVAAKKRRKKKTAAQASGSAAGHTYEHFRDKWDKFDVDAALRDADEDTEYETDTEDEGAQLTERSSRQLQPAAAPGPVIRGARSPEDDAEFWRAKGNEYFKFGDMKKAKECYTSSVAALPSAAAYANRGLVCLKSKEWAGAERDCTEALSMDPGYVKALQRRAAARKELGNVIGALGDLDAALRLLPRDASLSRDLRATLRGHAAASGLVVPSANLVQLTTLAAPAAAPAASGNAPLGEVLPAAAGSAAAASASGSRADGDGSAARGGPASDVAASGGAAVVDGAGPTPSAAVPTGGKTTGPADSPALPRFASPADISAGALDVPTAPVSAAQRLTTGVSAKLTPETPALAEASADRTAAVADASSRPRGDVEAAGARDQQGVSARVDGVGADARMAGAADGAARTQPDSNEAGVPRDSSARGDEGAQVQRADVAGADGGAADEQPSRGAKASTRTPAVDMDLVAGATRAAAGASQSSTRVPTTSIEFEVAWRACRNDAARERAFLRNISPGALPGVFKSSLTPAVLAGVARAAVDECAGAGSGGDEDGRRHGVEVLRALTRVDRFAMNAMLVSGAAKTALKAAWEAACGGGGAVAADLAELRPLFRV